MAGEAASALGLSLAVLAERPDDAACDVAAEVMLGSPLVATDLRAFTERCDVVTFDHEQVDLEIVAALAAGGAVLRPGAETLELAVDKAHMRAVLDGAGVPVPSYLVVDGGPDASAAVASFAAAHGWPVMVKAARGGYDGKGVWPVRDRAEAEKVLAQVDGQVVVEELLPLDAELAVMVARRPSGAVGRLAGGRDGPGRRGLPGGAGARAAGPRRRRGRLGAGAEGGRDRRRRRRHGRGALLVGRPVAGQRGGHPAPQLGPLDD